jgi:predicted kinase
LLVVAGSQIKRADCSSYCICVKSLNMRKWLRDRLGRKKKGPEQGSQPAPPPLQPAYFDADQVPDAAPEVGHDSAVSAPLPPEPEPEVHSAAEEPSTAEAGGEARPRPAGTGQASRGRRRRGGRGRGGRGREQAVASAFTPAAAKGIAPDPADTSTGDIPESSEAEGAAPRAPKPPAAVPAASARPPKGIVVLAIGLPGSGKSSWFKRHNIVPLSSDMVRSLLFDDIREQRFQDLVFSNLRSMLNSRLIAKRPMNYVDATNLTPQERQHWIKLAKDYNYEVHAVFFDVPLEVCLDRHQRRDRVVPDDIMRRMAAKLKPPSFEEGFAKITVVRVKKKEDEAT